FLAAGRPVLLPPTNLALDMTDGEAALFLHTGTPEDIATQCERVFRDPDLARPLGAAGTAFAGRHFDLPHNTGALLGLYEQLQHQPANPLWSHLADSEGSDLALMPFLFAEPLAAGEKRGDLAAAFSALIRLTETQLAVLKREHAREIELRKLSEQHARNL